mmetsp:Transcript_40981/g.129494  ORF Transcript_40981/g.129494 Transcript_40981/m.129494 type:complete len:242 (+) Transcript_40981:763-1488(+)
MRAQLADLATSSASPPAPRRSRAPTTLKAAPSANSSACPGASSQTVARQTLSTPPPPPLRSDTRKFNTHDARGRAAHSSSAPPAPPPPASPPSKLACSLRQLSASACSCSFDSYPAAVSQPAPEDVLGRVEVEHRERSGAQVGVHGQHCHLGIVGVEGVPGSRLMVAAGCEERWTPDLVRPRLPRAARTRAGRSGARLARGRTAPGRPPPAASRVRRGSRTRPSCPTSRPNSHAARHSRSA